MTKSDTLKIVIGGDLCPFGRVEKFLEQGDSHHVFGTFLGLFQQSDLLLANLECPLVLSQTPAIKGGPVLGASIKSLAGLKNAGFHLLGLANNHIMDHGRAGLFSTLDACHAAGIETVGAGINAIEAAAIWVRSYNRIRVGVMAVAEAEYSLAGTAEPGANSMDFFNTARKLREARDLCDFLVVLVHGGNEHLAIPRPGLRNFCQWLVEEGAKVVVCQHSHCIGTYEEYGTGLIVYGQGNLLFDMPSKHKTWQEGILVDLEIAPDLTFKYDFIPYETRQSGDGIDKPSEVRSRAIMSDFRRRSEIFHDKELLEKQWQTFCESKRSLYMSIIHGFGRVLSVLNRMLPLTEYLYTKSQRRNIGNIVRCESHHEVLVTLADMDLASERRRKGN